MNSLTTDTQDEIVRALEDKIHNRRFYIQKYRGIVMSTATRAEEKRLAKAIAAYNEVAEQLNIKPIDPND